MNSYLKEKSRCVQLNNHCKISMQRRSSQLKRNLCSRGKKAVPVYEIHIFIISCSCFTFPHAANHFKNFPSSQLVCQLNQLERCAPGKSPFFSPSSSTSKKPSSLPPPYIWNQLQNVYCECLISTILRTEK